MNRINYNFLPPEHRPDGWRRLHDDWPWPLCYVPRTWTAYPILVLPIKILGNQEGIEYLNTGIIDNIKDIPIKNSLSPAPIGNCGTWQFSIVKVRTRLGGVWLPYMAATFENGFHFRLGARFSDDLGYFYVEFPSMAVKKLE